ncbi:MAG: chorismate synthase [Chitinophagaceae bacterium]
MNSFGTLFKIAILGESHGEYVGIVIDGCPAGIALEEADFWEDIVSRKGGKKFTTPRKEKDIPLLATGIFKGKTTGAPLTILFRNKNIQSVDYEKQRDIDRPSHIDFVAHKKYKGYEDFRGSGHFSGRLTLALVAAGVVAKKMLPHITIKAHIVEIAGEKDIHQGLQKSISQKDSVGGVIACRVENIPIGWGEPFFDSMESVISHLIFSIPGIRAIEFGKGFEGARMLGTEHNDAITNAEGTTKTNHAGGVVGGITNGNPLYFKVAVKPTSSTPKKQYSWNKETLSMSHFNIKGRHDLCIALRIPVIVEAVTAIALVDFMKRNQ